jgi:tetratricopeptide (TPR) repeat protein
MMQKILLVTGILLLAYFKSFTAGWHLDDGPNILLNSKLHITNIDFQQLNNSLRAAPTALNKNTLYRPIPCLTFGITWYFVQDDVFFYHVINLLIHIVTTFFLFLTLNLLLRIYYRKEKYTPQFFLAAAFLSALFWALAPIQTQAVTYIVQRMASMSAMFSIIAIYTYLRGKNAVRKKYLWFLICLVSFFAALGSKENAILLLPSLLLLEFSFFRHHVTKKKIFIVSSLLLAAFISAFCFVHYGLGLTLFDISNPQSFLDSYSNRSFTFSERILTQPRIVLMYLSQIFLPMADRLSIAHDVVLSTSLFSPWTTFPSIVLILLLIVGSLVFLKKYPLVCFPVLFFFLNHAVESTILQLELVFEHRNYLPSLFLFLPIGVLVARILYSTPPPRTFRRAAAVCCTTLFLIISGQATYTRNLAWATEGTLWTDAIRKAPNSSRAAHNLGEWYRQFAQYQQAYYYFQLALRHADKAADPRITKTLALNGVASVDYMLGRYEQSLQYFSRCLEIGPKESCLKNRVLAYLQLGQPEKALPDALELVQEYPLNIEYQYLMAVAAYQSGDYETALNRMQKIAGRSLNDYRVMQLAGIMMIKKGAYPNSLFFLKQASRLSPNDIDCQLSLAVAYYGNNQAGLTETVLQDIINKHPLPVITNALKTVRLNILDGSAVNFIENRLDGMINAIHSE